MLDRLDVSVSSRPGVLSARQLMSGVVHLNGWVQSDSSAAVEAMARAGFASVTLDVQHGFMTYDRVVEGIAAAALADTPALVRLPMQGFGLGARALDAGAAGVIAPMIDDADDARAFVDAVKFPPVGRRSWGPNRSLTFMGLGRDHYLEQANTATLALAMIETERGLDQVDAILAVEGLDGVLIGPNDLSVSLTGGKTVDPAQPGVLQALDLVRDAAERAGKPAAIFANTPAFATDYLRRGFRFVALGPDLAFLGAGARRAIAAIDAPPPPED